MPEPVAAFVLDPPERLDAPTDTSLALMRAALRQGFRVVFCTPGDLRLEDSQPLGRVRPVSFSPGEELFRSGPPDDIALGEIAVLFMRKDPPVDRAYLEACAILDRLPPEVLQINPAKALLRHGEKMIPSYFPGLAPPTLVTSQEADLQRFLHRHGRIVVKPLEDCSGRGIIALGSEEGDAHPRLAEITENGARFVQGQKFLPEIVDGDKRVLLLGGEILGWVRRVPAAGEFRSNVNAGGRCVPCDLTDADREICARLRPWLIAEGIHLAGVDIVGPHVLEVNITSPSCLREMNELTGAALEDRVLAYVVGKQGGRR